MWEQRLNFITPLKCSSLRSFFSLVSFLFCFFFWCSSRFTVLCQFLLYSTVTWSYIYIYSFSHTIYQHAAGCLFIFFFFSFFDPFFFFFFSFSLNGYFYSGRLKVFNCFNHFIFFWALSSTSFLGVGGCTHWYFEVPRPGIKPVLQLWPVPQLPDP